jgi:hypothetical protein
MASKIIVDQLESSGSNITIPTGTGLVVTDGIASSSLPTIPVTKGGTGLTSLGSANQQLRVNSSGNALEFATISSGGLKQIVFAQTASAFTHSSSSYADLTGISVNITPSSSSNKVLVMSDIQYNITTSNRGFQARIMRDSTSILEPNNQKENYIQGTGAEHHGRSSYMFLDTPNTKSQITYKMQVYVDGSQAVTFNNSCYSYIYAMEVAV